MPSYIVTKKPFPYDDRCVFLHEHSKLCRYGGNCKRTYCMFKHDDKQNEEKSELNENVGDSIECDKAAVDHTNIINVSNEKMKYNWTQIM